MPLYLQVCVFVSTSACVLVCVSWPSADCVLDTHHNGTILYHLLGNRNQTINKMCQFAKHFPRLRFALTKKARKKQKQLAEIWTLARACGISQLTKGAREGERDRQRGRVRTNVLFDRRLNGRTFREFQREPGIHFIEGKPPEQSPQHPPGSR